MAKYNDNSIYPEKSIFSPNDSFLFTDSEQFKRQKTGSFKNLSKFINAINGTTIVSYVYSNLTDVLLNENTKGYFSTNSNVTLIQNITAIKINKFNFGELNLTELYDFIKNNSSKFTLKLKDSDNQNIFGYFNIESIVKVNDHYRFNVNVLQNNLTLGSLKNGGKYVFDLNLKGANTEKRIISQTGFTEQGNTRIINAGWIWETNNTIFSNPVPYSFPIPLAASGLKRIDRIALGNSNIPFIQRGEESEVAIAPTLGSDNLEATFLIVSEATIGSPTNPVLGGPFVRKSEKYFGNVNAPGQNSITIYGESSYIMVSDLYAPFGNLQFLIDNVSSGYVGKNYIIYNNQVTNLTIVHNPSGSGVNRKYFKFPNLQNFTLKPGEQVEFIEHEDRKLHYLGTISTSSTLGQSRWSFTDFYIASGGSLLNGSGINGGVLENIQSYSATGAALIKYVTTAGSGYRLVTMYQYRTIGGCFYCEFTHIGSFSERNTHIGWLWLTGSQASLVTDNTGTYAYCRNGVTGLSTASGFTTEPLIANEAYGLLIDYVSATRTDFKLKKFSTGAIILNSSISTNNAPLSQYGFFGIQAVKTTASTSADVLMILDYIGFGPEKPEFLKTF